jgi:hypothetical protein
VKAELEPHALAIAICVLAHAPRVGELVDDPESPTADFCGPGMSRRDYPGSGIGDIDADLTVGTLDRHREVRVRVPDAVRSQLGDDQRRGVDEAVGLTSERFTNVATRGRGRGGSVSDQVALAMKQYLKCSRPRSAAIGHRTLRPGSPSGRGERNSAPTTFDRSRPQVKYVGEARAFDDSANGARRIANLDRVDSGGGTEQYRDA